MKIFYEDQNEEWYHNSRKTELSFGGEKVILSQQKADLNSLYFDLQVKENHVGPLVGIMTARNSDGKLVGNIPLFINLQIKLISLHGISFIFTLDDVNDNGINGYTYLPDQNRWYAISVPLPDLIYNRIPFRKSEENENFHTFVAAINEKNIPFFNPSFVDKFEIHQLFEMDSILQKYLPKTEKVSQKDTFFSFLKNNPSVYLKPSNSSRGKGIYLLKKIDQSDFLLQGLGSIQKFPTLQAFWKEWGNVLKTENYIVQEAIQSAQIEGKRFDFRILAHAEKGTYTVTGVGIRQSQTQEITTHIPNGGRILPYRDLQTDEHDSFIKTVVGQIGITLTEGLGFFGEFSIDAGLSLDGKYFIYEVNSKPMSFDESEIDEKKINQLCRLFLQLTNFDESDV